MDITVIGGADGPTSIFITGINWYTFASAVVVCIGIVIFYIRKRKRDK